LNSNLPPLVSVIMPAFNCEAFVAEALDSIFAQSYTHIEVVVIDDGSTDGTLAVLEEYKSRYDIQILKQKNSGSAIARSAGMAVAQGPYLAFLDSDDKWLPGKLAEQVNFLETHSDFGLVCSNWVTWCPNQEGEFDENVSPVIGEQAYSGWLYCDLLLDCVVWTSSVLMRRSVYEQVGDFNAELRRGQDYDYWLRISRLTRIHKLDSCLAVYRLNEASVTNRPNKINYEYLLLTDTLGKWGYRCVSGKTADEERVQKRLSEICFSFAYHQFYSGDISVALSSILTSLRHDKLRVSSWVYLGLICSKHLYQNTFKKAASVQ